MLQNPYWISFYNVRFNFNKNFTNMFHWFLVLFLTATPQVKAEYMKHLKFVMCGAAPIGELDEERFIRKVGQHISIHQGKYEVSIFIQYINHFIAGFGMTEGSLIATSATKQCQNIKAGGSVGKPIPNTLAKVVSIDDAKGISICVLCNKNIN